MLFHTTSRIPSRNRFAQEVIFQEQEELEHMLFEPTMEEPHISPPGRTSGAVGVVGVAAIDDDPTPALQNKLVLGIKIHG